ncbi:DUF55-domain-containing protein [Periconia macrospinosa]|uniref:Thymocyte nuclear protein 1 n=1 Tax=Periconia macrospinosa TaxID=97972 RepID=A0A2V1E3A7_9PLEO|nr:DUF55-domain-containing protein [Periconia macrospinosa]
MAPKRKATRQSAPTENSKNIDGVEPPKSKRPKRNGTNTTRTKPPKNEDDFGGEADSTDQRNLKTPQESHSSSPPPEKPTKPPKRTAKSTQKPAAPQTKAAKPSSTKSSAAKTSSSVVPPTITTTAASETNRDANGAQQTFWLLKAEPLPRYENGHNVSFSIDDLAGCTKAEPWTGVRNFQARNNMLSMRTGDLGFFYHSNAKPSGIAGILRVVEEAKPDETAFDPEDPYYDKKSEQDKPKWWCVGVEFVSKYDEVLSLADIKEHSGKGGELENLQLIKNGRLSVCKVTREEWVFLKGLAEGVDKNE